jgi:3-methyladenine DNA glycosylase AlkD
MNANDADELGAAISLMIANGRSAEGQAMLAPNLVQRVPFRLLDRIGARIGNGPLPETNDFLDKVAREKALGAWPLIGSALAAQLGRDLQGALQLCRAFIVSADVWYAADTLAERVSGAALVADFNRALAVLADWRKDSNRWVRKSAAVAIHLWTKRSRGESRHLPKVRRLLVFLAPMFFEQDLDAAKGIGWALKTLGRYYPDAVTPWLVRQAARKREHRAVILRKATTYLPAAARKRVTRAAAR